MLHNNIEDLLAKRSGKEAAELRSALDGRRTWQGDFTCKQSKRELRGLKIEVEVESEQDQELRLTGYSAVFDKPSEVMFGMFREYVKRGAFKRVLKENPDVRLLENHEGRPHARTINGTLVLREEPEGLYREALLDSRRKDSNDLYYAVERGDYSQSSFAFTVKRDEWIMCDCAEKEGDEYMGCSCVWTRNILEIGELYDDSIVTYPAYPDSTAEAVPVTTSDEDSNDDATRTGDMVVVEQAAQAEATEQRTEQQATDTVLPDKSRASGKAESIRIWLALNK